MPRLIEYIIKNINKIKNNSFIVNTLNNFKLKFNFIKEHIKKFLFTNDNNPNKINFPYIFIKKTIKLNNLI